MQGEWINEFKSRDGIQDLKTDEMTVTLRSRDSNQQHKSLFGNCRLQLSVLKAPGFRKVDGGFVSILACSQGSLLLVLQRWVQISKMLMNLCCADGILGIWIWNWKGDEWAGRILWMDKVRGWITCSRDDEVYSFGHTAQKMHPSQLQIL